MQVFKTKTFARWARGEGLGDDLLTFAVAEMEVGLIDARLGGSVCKKRIALDGRGKRGSTRTIVAYLQAEKAFFVYGFAKSERSNITPNELQALKLLAKELLAWSPAQLEDAVRAGELIRLEE
jgi:hypothetical protein